MIYLLGAIGSGKTSLTTLLASKLNSNAYYEKVEDMPMLQEYYRAGADSRKELSFQLQIAFLNYRYTQLRHAIVERNAVMDSSLLSDNIMAKMIHDRGEMTDTQFDLYQSLSENMVANVSGHPFHGFPDLIILLDISLEKELEQISLRGRDMETSDLSLLDYYKSVNQAYKRWYDGYVQSPVLKINMDNIDFVGNPVDQRAVLVKIADRGKQLGIFNSVEYKQLTSKP